jgi:hypothetical protein
MSAVTEYVSDALLVRIKAEYSEMPGLRLTVPQAARLWALDLAICENALERLAESRYLRRTADGAYTLTPESLLACAWHTR